MDDRDNRLAWIERASELLPSFLKHSDFPQPARPFGKVFASAWIGDVIIAGTKDNRLITWNQNRWSTSFAEIPLPGIERRPPGSHCGIHCIAANPAGTLFATGARNPNDIAVFSLPTFRSVNLLQGHTDWLFGLDFVSDEHFVSGSRDSLVKLWSTKMSMSLETRKAHGDKVRGVKCKPQTQKFYTIGNDGTLKIWDANTFTVEVTVVLPEPIEVVAIALNASGTVVAVGSQHRVTLIDAMSGYLIDTIPSLESDWGIRSLAWNHHVLSIGSGAGSMSFYDTKRGRYIPNTNENLLTRTGPGWFFDGASHHYPNSCHAVHTHCYDPTGLRMFVAGGPLMLNLNGGYASVWW